ncbi:MAG: acyltransferase family protein, partial [Actinomycetota bacterium]
MTTGDGRQRIPGLDGLRALAVVAVLLFHLRVDIARGGFLGVSLFFTLSGYLITRLLLEEHRGTGTIALVPFWGRRLRRLMPAALVTLAAVTVAALAFDVFESSTVRGDLWAALGYVANWRFMSASTSYADLFVSAPSPVVHFWSLAIEEQFYFVFPVVLLALLGRRGRRRTALIGLGVLWVASVSSALVGASDNVVYYGLHTRAAELLTGALVALVLADGSRRPGGTLHTRLANGAVTVALAGFVALVITTDTGDRWLYRGGLAAVSLLSVILVVGVQSPGPWQWLAERRQVVAIGELSYGLYLVHWPVFLILDADRTGLDGVALAGLRLAVTWAVAWTMAAAIERPIRRARLLPTTGHRAAALAIGLTVMAGVMFFVPRTPPVSLAGLEAPDEVVDFGSDEPEVTIAVLGSQPSAVA